MKRLLLTLFLPLFLFGWGGQGSGSSTFTGLSDTPDSYSGQAGKYLGVNGAENAVDFSNGTSAPMTGDAIEDSLRNAMRQFNLIGVTDPKHILLVDDDYTTTDSTHFNNFWLAKDRANALPGEVIIYVYPGYYDSTEITAEMWIDPYVHIIGVGDRDSIRIRGDGSSALFRFSGGGTNIVKNLWLTDLQTGYPGNCKDLIAPDPTGGHHEMLIENVRFNAPYSTAAIHFYGDVATDTTFGRIYIIKDCIFENMRVIGGAGNCIGMPKVRKDSLCFVMVDNCAFLGTGQYIYSGGNFNGGIVYSGCYFDSVVFAAQDGDTFAKTYISGTSRRSSFLNTWAKNCYFNVISDTSTIIQAKIDLLGSLKIRPTNDTMPGLIVTSANKHGSAVRLRATADSGTILLLEPNYGGQAVTAIGISWAGTGMTLTGGGLAKYGINLDGATYADRGIKIIGCDTSFIGLGLSIFDHPVFDSMMLRPLPNKSATASPGTVWNDTAGTKDSVWIYSSSGWKLFWAEP